MNTHIKNEILAHAEKCYPAECCGLIVNIRGVPAYWPCQNTAEGTDNFSLSHLDYAEAEDAGEIIAVVHSHPNAPVAPSQADMVACEASGLPWHIVSWPDKEWSYLTPTGYKAPLIGRVWSHGVLDCYSIVRDYYMDEKGIELPDFERHDDWWHKGQNLYVDNFQKAGFVRVLKDEEKPEIGDVLLMQVLARVPNHAAVYIGDNKILHHLHNRLSCREVWDGYYKKHTVWVLRYDGKAQNNLIG